MTTKQESSATALPGAGIRRVTEAVEWISPVLLISILLSVMIESTEAVGLAVLLVFVWKRFPWVGKRVLFLVFGFVALYVIADWAQILVLAALLVFVWKRFPQGGRQVLFLLFGFVLLDGVADRLEWNCLSSARLVSHDTAKALLAFTKLLYVVVAFLSLGGLRRGRGSGAVSERCDPGRPDVRGRMEWLAVLVLLFLAVGSFLMWCESSVPLLLMPVVAFGMYGWLKGRAKSSRRGMAWLFLACVLALWELRAFTFVDGIVEGLLGFAKLLYVVVAFDWLHRQWRGRVPGAVCERVDPERPGVRASVGWLAVPLLLFSMAGPVFTLRAFPVPLLLVPVVAFGMYGWQRVRARLSRLSMALLFFSCVSTLLVFRVFTGFAFGDPVAARAGMVFLLGVSFVAVAMCLARSDWGRVAAAGGVLLVSAIAFVAVPRDILLGRTKHFPLSVGSTIWRQGEAGSEAILIGAYMDRPRVPEGASIISMRRDTCEPDMFDAYLVRESGETPPKLFSDEYMYLETELDGKPLFYHLNVNEYALLLEDGSMDAITSSVAGATCAGIRERCVSPDGRYFVYGMPTLERNEWSGARDHYLGVYDRQTRCFSLFPEYGMWDVAAWPTSQTLLVFLGPSENYRTGVRDLGWKTLELDLASGGEAVVREGVLERYPRDSGLIGGRWFACLGFAGESKDGPMDLSRPFLLDILTGETTPVPPKVREYPWGWHTGGNWYGYTSSAGDGLRLLLLDAAGEVRSYPLPHGRPFVCARVSPDGKRVAFLQEAPSAVWEMRSCDVGVMDLETGKIKRIGVVAHLWDTGRLPWSRAFGWSPDGRRLGYHVSRFHPLALRWWLVYRRLPDILTFVEDEIDILRHGPRDCGTGMVWGPPFPRSHAYRVVDVVARGGGGGGGTGGGGVSEAVLLRELSADCADGRRFLCFGGGLRCGWGVLWRAEWLGEDFRPRNTRNARMGAEDEEGV